MLDAASQANPRISPTRLRLDQDGRTRRRAIRHRMPVSARTHCAWTSLNVIEITDNQQRFEATIPGHSGGAFISDVSG
jgi:hypothetical protein